MITSAEELLRAPDGSIAAAFADSEISRPTTETHLALPPIHLARPVDAAGALPMFPRPLARIGLEGRALVCAGDVIDGTYRHGLSVLAAPGETLRFPDGSIDYRFEWRVAVHADRAARPLQSAPATVNDRSLSWVVSLLCSTGDLAAARGEAAREPLIAAVAWVAGTTREAIHWHLARVRPHLGRHPHPAVVEETQPLLRDQVLDAARVFGQGWVRDVLGPWAHLVSATREPSREYVLRGHAALAEHLRLRG